MICLHLGRQAHTLLLDLRETCYELWSLLLTEQAHIWARLLREVESERRFITHRTGHDSVIYTTSHCHRNRRCYNGKIIGTGVAQRALALCGSSALPFLFPGQFNDSSVVQLGKLMSLLNEVHDEGGEHSLMERRKSERRQTEEHSADRAALCDIATVLLIRTDTKELLPHCTNIVMFAVESIRAAIKATGFDDGRISGFQVEVEEGWVSHGFRNSALSLLRKIFPILTIANITIVCERLLGLQTVFLESEQPQIFRNLNSYIPVLGGLLAASGDRATPCIDLLIDYFENCSCEFDFKQERWYFEWSPSITEVLCNMKELVSEQHVARIAKLVCDVAKRDCRDDGALCVKQRAGILQYKLPAALCVLEVWLNTKVSVTMLESIRSDRGLRLCSHAATGTTLMWLHPLPRKTAMNDLLLALICVMDVSNDRILTMMGAQSQSELHEYRHCTEDLVRERMAYSAAAAIRVLVSLLLHQTSWLSQSNEGALCSNPALSWLLDCDDLAWQGVPANVGFLCILRQVHDQGDPAGILRNPQVLDDLFDYLSVNNPAIAWEAQRLIVKLPDVERLCEQHDVPSLLTSEHRCARQVAAAILAVGSPQWFSKYAPAIFQNMAKDGHVREVTHFLNLAVRCLHFATFDQFIRFQERLYQKTKRWNGMLEYSRKSIKKEIIRCLNDDDLLWPWGCDVSYYSDNSGSESSMSADDIPEPDECCDYDEFGEKDHGDY